MSSRPFDKGATWRKAVVLALVAIATVVGLALATELAARALLHESPTSTMWCLVVDDPATGTRGIPNSSCLQKTLESATVTYHFDACGYRDGIGCTPKADGTFRIVLIGSSYVMGMHVPQDRTFASLLSGELSRRLGRRIEVANQGMQWGTPSSLALRTADMLRAQPDLILWTPTPLDIENAAAITPFVPGLQMGVVRPGAEPAHAETAPKDGSMPRLSARIGRVWQRVTDALGDTRTAFLLKHLLYRSDSQFLDHALLQGGSIDYLRTSPTPAWRTGLAYFGEALQRVVGAARDRHVQVVVALLPFREQYVMLASGAWPNGFDPHAEGRAVRPVVEAHGATYIESLSNVRPTTASGALFYPVDQHPNVRGHAWMATLLADRLVDPRRGTIAGIAVGTR